MLDDKLSDFMTHIQQAAMKVGPQVMQFAVQHEHWCGVGDICIGFFLLALSLVLLWCVKKIIVWINGEDDTGEFEAIILFVTGFGCLFTFICAAIQLLNIWNWVAIYNPKIALFHDVLTKILSK